MRRFLLALVASLAFAGVAQAQTPCIGVGGVNNVPQVGLSCSQEPAVDTYVATGIGIVPVAAGATDVACLTGSATRVVRLQNVRVSGSATTLVNVPVSLLKRAVADTAGTLATTTALPVPYRMDSNDSAPSATTTAWVTVNPTINDATPGIVDTQIVGLQLPGTTLNNAALNFNYLSHPYSEAPTLRGIAQQLCINFNTTAVTAGLVNISFQWTEALQ